MTFLLSLIASGVGVSACLYAAAGLALLIRRDWSDGVKTLALSLIPFGLYAVAWMFLPMGNWLIVPGTAAAIFSAITFFIVLRNGV
jgi:hypothetical protein